MIQVTSAFDFAAYDRFVSEQRTFNAYHLRGWTDVLARSYGYIPATLVALDASGEIAGVLPLMRVHGRLKGRRLVSLPFSHCVPMLTSSPAVEAALLDAAIDLARSENYAYVELKTRQPIEHEAFQPSMLNKISELSLAPADNQLFSGFSKGNRRDIRKAESADFVIRRAESHADFDSFHRLEVITRQRQGAPVYPAKFFRHMADSLSQQVNLYLAAYQGRDVAGIITLNAGKQAIYGYGASVRDNDVITLYPNNLLIWHAIQAAKASGLETFDFGTTPLHLESLLAFKNRFRPQHSDLAYWYYLNEGAHLPVIKRDSARVKLVSGLLRLMPRPLFKRLSPLLLREVG
jgi:CelD/BcsL family acetyltransferase involved in cellulose biosynthesis